MIKINDVNKSDEELVALTLKDTHYYRHLVQKYEDKLRRYIIRFSNLSKEDANDILQEVFIKAYQNLNDFDANLKFSSWIYRIAHNETISYLRKMKISPQPFDIDVVSSLIDKMDSDLSIEGKIDNKYLKENIRRVLGRLNEAYRSVLILRYVEDKNYNEISDIIRKPINTVGTLLNRAKQRLKEEILKDKFFIERHG